MSDISEFQKEFCADIGEILEQNNTHDVIIYVGEEPSIKEYKAHSIILCARSHYFLTALSADWAKKEDGIFVFKKPNILPKVFEVILNATVDLKSQEAPEILKLLIAVDELELDNLSAHIQQYLIKEKHEWLNQNFVQALDIVFRHEACHSLRDYCLEAICANPKLIFESKSFHSIDRSILLMLLKRDDLDIEEIKIWEYLIDWGTAQHTSLKKEVSKWSREDFIAVAATLEPLLPLIRWGEIESSDFQHKGFSYKRVFPEPLFDNIIEHYLNSSIPIQSTLKPRLPAQIDSTIIDKKIARVIGNWIAGTNSISEQKHSYKFENLFRASRDGFDSGNFHSRCDNKGPTFTIVKLSSNNIIVGGYNPLNWTSNIGYEYSNSNFIFQFSDSSSQSGLIGRIKAYNQNAVYNHPSYGPTFGGGNDFLINGTYWRHSAENSYPNIFPSFSVGFNHQMQEYEVFRVL
ncbi:hypothetical protein G9A89_019577 [Geosiphon pyriformis]|nr:hypothetical protein G9A89_019577 [Geosiphon pyriformis]